MRRLFAGLVAVRSGKIGTSCGIFRSGTPGHLRHANTDLSGERLAMCGGSCRFLLKQAAKPTASGFAARPEGAMNVRTIAVLAAMVAVPAAAAAQDHKCACCADKHASHKAHGTATTPAAPSVEPQASPAAPTGAPVYDAAHEGLFTGIVYSVMRHQGMDVQLTVGVGEATFEVLVAPMDWLDRQNIVFRSGEKVTVVGSRQDPAAPNTIIAREIRSTGQTVVLRDSDGKGLWN
jgi:hypothetical protein